MNPIMIGAAPLIFLEKVEKALTENPDAKLLTFVAVSAEFGCKKFSRTRFVVDCVIRLEEFHEIVGA